MKNLSHFEEHGTVHFVSHNRLFTKVIIAALEQIDDPYKKQSAEELISHNRELQTNERPYVFTFTDINWGLINEGLKLREEKPFAYNYEGFVWSLVAFRIERYVCSTTDESAINSGVS